MKHKVILSHDRNSYPFVRMNVGDYFSIDSNKSNYDRVRGAPQSFNRNKVPQHDYEWHVRSSKMFFTRVR